MNYAYSLNGGTPVVKVFKIGASIATVGMPIEATIADSAGVAKGDPTAWVDAVGVNLDTGTYSTTQGDAEGVVAVVVNFDAVWRARMNEGATAGTNLAILTNSSANTAGTTVTITTGDAAPNSPELDEGTIACISGANMGLTRKITSTTATTAVVTVPFPRTIAAGDVFVITSASVGLETLSDNRQFTTNMTETRADIAVGTGATAVTVEIEWDFSSTLNARRNTYEYLMADDHVLNIAT